MYRIPLLVLGRTCGSSHLVHPAKNMSVSASKPVTREFVQPKLLWASESNGYESSLERIQTRQVSQREEYGETG